MYRYGRHYGFGASATSGKCPKDALTGKKLAEAKAAKKCVQKKVCFKGKTFTFRVGRTCGPRKKPSTKHLKTFKERFAGLAQECKGQPRAAFLRCMASGELPAKKSAKKSK
jgi:hypothetical protein